MTSVCDLHCDLLSYLALDETRNPYQEASRCSLPQMQKGSVRFQTLAIFCETKKNSSEEGYKQLLALKKLDSSFVPLKDHTLPWQSQTPEVFYLPALENASSFAEEDEPLSKAFARFEYFTQEAGPFLYVSLTWNTENRFGGGNATKIGLKKDGEHLLEYLSGKNVAIDFSHTSDALAYDIFNHIEKKGLNLKVLASHSNFRTLNAHPRNLSDEMAKEIGQRKGIIGLNLFRAFIGDDFENALVKIVHHADQMQLIHHLCFGADFFYDRDFSLSLKYPEPFFHPNYGDSSCYPKIQLLFEKHFSKEIVSLISYKNFTSFYENNFSR